MLNHLLVCRDGRGMFIMMFKDFWNEGKMTKSINSVLDTKPISYDVLFKIYICK